MGEKEMCDTHAYLINGDREEKILDNVDKVEINGHEITMISIFGEQKTLNAKFKSFG